jgi:hypothetical protein
MVVAGTTWVRCDLGKILATAPLLIDGIRVQCGDSRAEVGGVFNDITGWR